MARLLFLQNVEYEFLGPMYISAILRQNGHECKLAIGHKIEGFAPTIDRFQPNLIGFSIMTGSHLWAQHMASIVKDEYGIMNVFGGAHPTFFLQFIENKNVDMIIRGEGEEAILEIMNRIDTNRKIEEILNLSLKQNHQIIHYPVNNLQQNLDELPFPDRHLYDILEDRVDQTVRKILTSRGCPYHCSFCSADVLREMYRGKGNYVRFRKIEKVIEECLQLKNINNVRTIYFADDVFGINKEWLYEFLPEFKKQVGLEFMCQVRADLLASDEEYAVRLAEGGCRSVFFGVESGNQQLRNLILQKQISDSQIFKAAESLHQAGIKFRTYNMIGIPGETIEDAYATIEMNIKIKTNYPWCSLYTPFPGTKLSKYAQNRGYLPENFAIDNLSQSFFHHSYLKIPNIEKMVNLQRFFQTVVLWPWTFRMVKYLISLKPNLLYLWWFGLIYLYIYIKSEGLGIWITLKFSLRNWKHILQRQ
jgi:anaerobic magnesium-protoporphyrin IX monomethyl ester cyclase